MRRIDIENADESRVGVFATQLVVIPGRKTGSKQLIQPMLRPPQPNVWEDSPRQQPVVNINLVVPPEAIRVVIDQVAPVVHVNVPEQKPPDVVVNLPEIRFPEIPAPVVNVEVPRQ